MRRIAVLGAGRLHDVEPALLLERADEIHLFDLDSACGPVWKAAFGPAYGRRVKGRFEDVTGCIEAWTSALPTRGDRNQLIGCLQGLRAPDPRWSDDHFDVILSLNLLGQIPLYWRDRVLETVRVGDLDQDAEILSAIDESMGRLQSAHMSALRRRPETTPIVITDTEYYYYESDSGVWRIEPALFGEAPDMWATLRASSSVTRSDAWWWHVAPQFVEDDGCGEIHRVEAIGMKPEKVLRRT